MHRIVIIAALAVFTGCRPAADTNMRISTPSTAATTSTRFEVARIGVFEDSLAYGDRRGIYVIKDTKTGKEYVGVSGIGVSELGSHRAGKTSVSDER